MRLKTRSPGPLPSRFLPRYRDKARTPLQQHRQASGNPEADSPATRNPAEPRRRTACTATPPREWIPSPRPEQRAALQAPKPTSHLPTERTDQPNPSHGRPSSLRNPAPRHTPVRGVDTVPNARGVPPGPGRSVPEQRRPPPRHRLPSDAPGAPGAQTPKQAEPTPRRSDSARPRRTATRHAQPCHARHSGSGAIQPCHGACRASSHAQPVPSIRRGSGLEA